MRSIYLGEISCDFTGALATATGTLSFNPNALPLVGGSTFKLQVYNDSAGGSSFTWASSARIDEAGAMPFISIASAKADGDVVADIPLYPKVIVSCTTTDGELETFQVWGLFEDQN